MSCRLVNRRPGSLPAASLSGGDTIMRRIITGLLLMLMSTVGCGNTSDSTNKGYSCTAKEAYTLSGSGTLDRGKTAGTFVIDRDSGRMSGELSNFGTVNGVDYQPTVLSRGDEEGYFKALTLYGKSQSTRLIVVEEFSEDKQKPFVFSTEMQFFVGTCVNT